MSKDQLTSLRKRIMTQWQVQQGTTVWAPWGKTGWSAVIIRTPQRKWAQGMRVKPHNEKEVAKGKVNMERLIKRDPKLKGKDRPELPPSDVFAKDEPEPVVEPAPAKETHPHSPGWKPVSEMNKKECAAYNKKIQRQLDLLGDDSIADDW